MLRISAETYAQNDVYNIIDKNKKNIVKKCVYRKKSGVKNIYDQIDKEI